MAVAPRTRRAGRVDIENREKQLKDELRKKREEEVKQEEFKFEKASPQEIDGIFRACHNLIWKKETISPTDAFYEFCKLFFIKLKQDKDLHNKYLSQKLEVPLIEFKFSEHWINQQDANNPVNDILFKQQLLPFLKEERDKKGKKRIFEDDENINLQSATIGGKTTIENGQVLCDTCNLSKGAG